MFDFAKFMAAMQQLLPAVGQTVVSLHPDNAEEAAKIQLGVALISSVMGAIHDASKQGN